MKIIKHPIPLTGTIECLGMAEEVDDIPGKGDEAIQRLLLAGKIKFKLGMNYSWLDANFRQHFGRIEHGDPIPRFVCVEKPGYEIKVLGFGEFELRQFRDAIAA